MHTTRLRLAAATVSLGLVPALLSITGAVAGQANAAPAPRTARRSPAPTHGIPHIVAKDFGSLGFGSGYAAAETSICTLADTVLTGRGQRSRYLGPNGKYDDQVSMTGTNLQVDTLVTDLHDRQVVEKLLASKAGPGDAGTRHGQGVRRRRERLAAQDRWHLEDHRPDLPWCGVHPAQRDRQRHLVRRLPRQPDRLDAATSSRRSPRHARRAPRDPGIPELPVNASFADAPKQLPDKQKLMAALGKDPKSPFGSNATAIGGAASTTGRGMVLGNPHFPWRGRYRFTQQQLTIPGSYDVAGGSLVGSPVVNIGWNKDVAWSHTVSTAYRFTPYEYQTLGTPTSYLTTEGIKQLDKRDVKVTVKNADGSLSTVTKNLYRTDQGYVLDDPATLMNWTPTSFFAIRDANGEQLRTIDTFLDMGKATSASDLLARQDKAGGMPWVNTTAADRSGNALYADHSVVPERVQRPRPEVHDARSAGCCSRSPVCPVSTAPVPAATVPGAPTPTPSAPASSDRRTFRTPSAATG